MPAPRRALLLVAVLALLAAQGSVARAEDGERAATAQLVYAREAGAERCPDESAVREAVKGRLGYDPFVAGAVRTVSATLRGTARGLSARIVLGGERGGRREISSPRHDCADLAPVVEMAIALAIDPISASRPGAPAPKEEDDRPGAVIIRELTGDDDPVTGGPPAPVPPPLPPEPPAPPRPAAAADRPGEPLRVVAGLGAHLGIGGASSLVYPGFAALLGIRQSGWSLSLELRGDLPIEADQPPGRISSSLLLGLLVPCLHLPNALRTMEVALCAMLGAGAQVTTLRGFTADQADHTEAGPSAQLGLRVGLEWPFGGRFLLRPRADVLLPLTLPTVSGTTWQAPRISGALGLDVLVYLR